MCALLGLKQSTNQLILLYATINQTLYTENTKILNSLFKHTYHLVNHE